MTLTLEVSFKPQPPVRTKTSKLYYSLLMKILFFVSTTTTSTPHHSAVSGGKNINIQEYSAIDKDTQKPLHDLLFNRAIAEANNCYADKTSTKTTELLSASRNYQGTARHWAELKILVITSVFTPKEISIQG